MWSLKDMVIYWVIFFMGSDWLNTTKIKLSASTVILVADIFADFVKSIAYGQSPYSPGQNFGHKSHNEVILGNNAKL